MRACQSAAARPVACRQPVCAIHALHALPMQRRTACSSSRRPTRGVGASLSTTPWHPAASGVAVKQGEEQTTRELQSSAASYGGLCRSSLALVRGRWRVGVCEVGRHHALVSARCGSVNAEVESTPVTCSL